MLLHVTIFLLYLAIQSYQNHVNIKIKPLNKSLKHKQIIPKPSEIIGKTLEIIQQIIANHKSVKNR